MRVSFLELSATEKTGTKPEISGHPSCRAESETEEAAVVSKPKRTRQRVIKLFIDYEACYEIKGILGLVIVEGTP